MTQEIKKQLREIRDICLEGRISIAQAIAQMEDTAGLIKGVSFKRDLKFNILTLRGMFNLHQAGLISRQEPIYFGIAVAGYYKAIQNRYGRGNSFSEPNEIHISREASTKHHVPGIIAIADRYGIRRVS